MVFILKVMQADADEPEFWEVQGSTEALAIALFKTTVPTAKILGIEGYYGEEQVIRANRRVH